jgi:hypothetical protein
MDRRITMNTTIINSIDRTNHVSRDVIGNRHVLNHEAMGLICSVRCPGGIVIKAFDAIREMRDAGG